VEGKIMAAALLGCSKEIRALFDKSGI